MSLRFSGLTAFILCAITCLAQEPDPINLGRLRADCVAGMERGGWYGYTTLKDIKVLDYKLLAWYRIRDARPQYVDNALCWAKASTDHGMMSVLVHMSTNPKATNSVDGARLPWNLAVVSDSPNSWLLFFSSPPNNKDVYSRMTSFTFKPEDRWEMYASELLTNAWESALGEKPAKSFSKGTDQREETSPASPQAVRVIVSTDFPPLDVIPVKAARQGDPPERCSDPDDVQSMVRFLLYVNEFDVEGLIASAGTFANVARKQNILNMLNLYDQVDENLRRHDPRYPTPERLRSVTWQGLDGAWGTTNVGTTAKPLEQILGKGKDSEASDAIIRVVDRSDPRPVWVCVWGGSREVAQAIWKVRETRSPAELERFLGKLRIYLVVKQDSTTDWLLTSFPNLFVILTEKNYMGMFWNMHGSDPKLADLAWINANIRQGHGPLGAAYPQSGWDPKYPGQQEGDTPSFLHLVSAGRKMNDLERPDQEGWGGKFVRPDPARNHWFDDPVGTPAVSRWRAEVQADFSRRADWMLP